LVDEYYFFIAPKILGGQDAKTAVGGAGCARMADAQDLDIRSVEQIGPDLLIHAYPKHH
ncbi:MAG: dihydrofolate reductase family protein, partial [Bacteroidales bacterium]|nr:dihydrofolate reductase family protein [Bacteroidales bacterium]